MIASSLQRVPSLLVAAALCAAPLPAFAAAPSKGKKAEPATDGQTVALMRFTGTETGTELRAAVQPLLEEAGYTVKGVALNVADAAKKVKCKGDSSSDDCLAAIGKWLNANPRTAADFIVLGDALEDGTVTVVIFDVAKGTRVETFETRYNEGDLILPIVLPQTMVTALDHHRVPPAPITAEEQAEIAALDEPEKTPEEIQAEKDAIAKAEEEAARAEQDRVISTDDIEVDLKKDFDAFCREGPRKKRASKEDPKDLRPACKRKAFWGYWQPRAWVALGLTSGTALATAGMYTMALVAKGPYNDAVDALDAYNASVNGDPRKNPNVTVDGDLQYDALATEVSRTGSIMRRRAIVGDVLLGTTVLLGGVLAIIIYQDRTDAKRFIKEEKSLRSISDLRVGPVLTRESQGLGMSFRF